jgi:hypothetical protein
MALNSGIAPTEPGYYWAYPHPDPHPDPARRELWALVEVAPDGPGARLVAWRTGWDVDYELEQFGAWVGPLDVPPAPPGATP